MMNKSDLMDGNISFMLIIFDCSQLVLTLGHQEKSFVEKKFLESSLNCF